MRFIISIFLIALSSFAASLYMPWWIIAVVSFIIALLIPQRPGIAFISGFAALFILWTGLSAWISSANDHLLAGKISLLILKADNPWLLIVLTGLTGAVIGGLASLTGSLIRYKKVS